MLICWGSFHWCWWQGERNQPPWLVPAKDEVMQVWAGVGMASQHVGLEQECAACCPCPYDFCGWLVD